MIPKLQPPIHLDLPSSSSPPALPGLVSSLRPLKRTLPQLVDEAALLRRFTYKNKNQFKGTQWWRKITEVDRTTARALDELTAALDEWGFKFVPLFFLPSVLGRADTAVTGETRTNCPS